MEKQTAVPEVVLNSGARMPVVGLGVYKATPEETYQAVSWALASGYRHIDTAAYYHNEKEVGQAIRDSGLKRSDVFVTTKLWNDDIGAGRAVDGLKESLVQLGLDYVDLYLLHWPVPGWEKAYSDLEGQLDAGLIKSLGVSNFLIHHLEKALGEFKTTPAVDQVETHPLFQVKDLLAYTREHGIALEAWRPLGGAGSKDLANPTVETIAKAHRVTPAQVALRWNIQRGVLVIPKSVHEERIKSNLDLFGFTLSDSEMAALAKLDDPKGRLGKDPDIYKA